MCGFSGFLHGSVNGFVVEPDDGLAELLKQRGPDAQRILKTEHGVFYHARLAIQDPGVGANQPFEDANYVLVFNGEIYNHKALRKQYSLECRDDSDTATLGALIDKLGPVATVRRLEGMYALAVYNKRTRELILSRDRYGQKPLYISVTPDIVFSSVLSTFIKHYSSRLCDLDIEGVEDYLALGYGLGDRTLLKGVRRVLPGEIVTLRWNGSRYTVISEHFDAQSHVFQGDTNEIEETVGDCLMSDRGVGALLSGGLDSSSVAAAMKSIGTSFTAYTLSFENKSFDETSTAARTAKTISCEHKNFTYTVQAADEVFRRLAVIFDDPIADPSMIPTAVLMKNVRNTDVVVLGGDGGDEQFGGYRRYKMARLATKLLIVPLLTRLLAAKVARFGLKRSQRIRNLYTWLGLGRSEENWNKFEAVITAKDLPEMASALICGSYYLKSYFSGVSKENLEKYLVKFDMESFLPNSVLTKVDRSSMAFGVECRAPFLSGKWASLGYQHHDGKERIKAYLKSRGLDFLVSVPKAGFGVPPTFLESCSRYKEAQESARRHSTFNDFLTQCSVSSTEFRRVILFKWLTTYEIL